MSTKPGHLVKTKDGKKGRTYNSKGFVNDKVPVYLEESEFKYSSKAILCEQDSLTVIGFSD